MHVVMVTRLFDFHVGGVERHVAAIAHEAVKDGHDVTIICSSDQKKSFPKKKGIQIHVIHIPSEHPSSFLEKAIDRIIIWGWMITHLSIFRTADVVHIHDVFWWMDPVRYLLPSLPLYLTFHGFETGSLPTTKAQRERQRASRAVRGTIAVGSWIDRWYKTQSTFVTYGGAQCLGDFARVRRLGAVFVGRLAEDTGVMEYIKACEEAKIHLDIYGWGPLETPVREHAEQSTYVQYLGTTRDTCAVLSSYQFACVSSYLSILEAFLCQSIVISYATNSLKADYLQSHPMHECMHIAKTHKKLVTTLRQKPQIFSSSRIRAHQWALNQTWGSVYTLYTKLWGWT